MAKMSQFPEPEQQLPIAIAMKRQLKVLETARKYEALVDAMASTTATAHRNSSASVAPAVQTDALFRVQHLRSVFERVPVVASQVSAAPIVTSQVVRAVARKPLRYDVYGWMLGGERHSGDDAEAVEDDADGDAQAGAEDERVDAEDGEDGGEGEVNQDEADASAGNDRIQDTVDAECDQCESCLVAHRTSTGTTDDMSAATISNIDVEAADLESDSESQAELKIDSRTEIATNTATKTTITDASLTLVKWWWISIRFGAWIWTIIAAIVLVICHFAVLAVQVVAMLVRMCFVAATWMIAATWRVAKNQRQHNRDMRETRDVRGIREIEQAGKIYLDIKNRMDDMKDSDDADETATETEDESGTDVESESESGSDTEMKTRNADTDPVGPELLQSPTIAVPVPVAPPVSVVADTALATSEDENELRAVELAPASGTEPASESALEREMEAGTAVPAREVVAITSLPLSSDQPASVELDSIDSVDGSYLSASSDVSASATAMAVAMASIAPLSGSTRTACVSTTATTTAGTGVTTTVSEAAASMASSREAPPEVAACGATSASDMVSGSSSNLRTCTHFWSSSSSVTTRATPASAIEDDSEEVEKGGGGCTVAVVVRTPTLSPNRIPTSTSTGPTISKRSFRQSAALASTSSCRDTAVEQTGRVTRRRRRCHEPMKPVESKYLKYETVSESYQRTVAGAAAKRLAVEVAGRERNSWK